MQSRQPLTRSASALFRSLPVPARVAVAIAAVLVAIYFWYFLIGIFAIAAMCVGAYHILRWFVSR